MFPAPQILALLIVTTPAMLVFDGLIVHALVMAATATLVAIVALRIRPGEVDFFLIAIRPLAVAAVVPAFWMSVQILPLKGLANPIWTSAAEVLGHAVRGSISVDRGATLISIAQYLSTAAIGLAAAAVAVDRHRCEWVLFSLAIAATLISAIVLLSGVAGLHSMSDGFQSVATDTAIDCAGLGVIITAAATLHIVERSRTIDTDRNGLAGKVKLTFAGCLFAFAICCLATIVNANIQTYFAIACGIATLAVAIAVRRFRLGRWGYSAVGAVALVVVAAVAAQPHGSRSTNMTLMFAGRASPPAIALAQRILTETSWTGTGAGTYASVLPIYRGIDELTVGPVAPTTAAAIAVEMGRPFLWVMLLAAIALAVALLRGSVGRKRDSFYAAAGASCIVTLGLLSFGNAGLFSAPTSLIAAATLGMAFGQHKSRIN